MKYATVTISVFLVLAFSCLPVSADEYRQNELIVKFKPVPGSSHVMAAGKENRPVIIAVDNAREALSEMQGRDDVEYVEPNYVIEAEDIPDDWPYDAAEWSALELPDAWDILDRHGPGHRVVVAVIDSGVDAAHPDLQGILTSGYDFANNDEVPEDDAGHGTKVCGIIGALGGNGIGVAGVAWNIDVGIMPLKFMKNNDGKTTGSLSDAVGAIYHAVDNGADIINASWGFYSYSYSLSDAIQYARDHGVMFICSAGNKGQDNDTNDHYPSNYPHENVIAVAAMNSFGELASFSNYGIANVDIAAPGVGICTTDRNGGYSTWSSGTSFATPFVTSVAAMVRYLSPGLGVTDVRSILLGSVIAGEGLDFQNIASGGCVNAYQALLSEAQYDASAKTSAPGTGGTDDNAVVASGEGGGGGGCLIDSGRNSGNPLGLVIIFSLTVLFRMPFMRRSG